MLLLCFLFGVTAAQNSTLSPSSAPTTTPSLAPSFAPSLSPSFAPSLAPSLAPVLSSAPSLVPSSAPSLAPSSSLAPSQSFQTAPNLTALLLPFQDSQDLNFTVLNISLNIAPEVTNRSLDSAALFLRNFKWGMIQTMGWKMFPYGPRIEVIDLRYQGSNTSVAIVMETKYNNQLLSQLTNNATCAACVGDLRQFGYVLNHNPIYECISGWAPECPRACEREKDVCAQSQSVNNQCIPNGSQTYTCKCLSMNYRAGPYFQSCVPLAEVSSGGVIAVAITGFVAALLAIGFVWWKYVQYQQAAKKKPTHVLARPQRVNTIGRISPIDNRHSISGNTSAPGTPDNSSGKSRLSTTVRPLTRGPSLAPGRALFVPAGRGSQVSGPKTVARAPAVKPPGLDPFSHKWNNSFQQMNFGGRKTKFSRLQAFTVFVSATCALVPAGLGLIIVTTDIARQEFRYDNNSKCDLSQNPQGTICVVDMVIEQDMAAPIHLHYRLGSFYQNHRSYVMSRDEKQLRAADSPDNKLQNCDPLSTGSESTQPPHFTPTFRDLNQSISLNTTSTAPVLKLYPCGLVAQSWFNDIIGACYIVSNETFCEPLTNDNWDKTEIVYEWDKKYKFVDRALRPNETKWNYFLGYQMPSLKDEDFIAWMRVAPKSTFSKFYRNILNQNLRAGDTLRFAIQNNFPVEAWGGQKLLVISTASVFGGKTTTLGELYVAVGVASAVFAFILWLFGGPDAYYHVLVKKGLCRRGPRAVSSHGLLLQ